MAKEGNPKEIQQHISILAENEIHFLPKELSPRLAHLLMGEWGQQKTGFKFFCFANIKVNQYSLNIARGTTDPEIDSVTWIKLGNNMAPRT